MCVSSFYLYPMSFTRHEVMNAEKKIIRNTLGPSLNYSHEL